MKLIPDAPQRTYCADGAENRVSQYFPVVTASLALLAGCQASHEQWIAFARSHEVDVTAGEYVIQPPDSITIHAPVSPEIDGANQRVRTDGKISLRLLGEVQVAGLTTEQAAQKLRVMLARYYEQPQVVVEVSTNRSKEYFVFGEVQKPGPQPYTGRDTLLAAVARAAPTIHAWRAQVRLIRPDPTGQAPKVIVCDLDAILRTGDASANVLLAEGDIVEVPPTPLAWLGHRVRDLIYPVEPVVGAYVAPAQAVEAERIYSGRAYDIGDRR